MTREAEEGAAFPVLGARLTQCFLLNPWLCSEKVSHPPPVLTANSLAKDGH